MICRLIFQISKLFDREAAKTWNIPFQNWSEWALDESRPVTERNQSRANFHYRMVEVVMMLLMPLLALALSRFRPKAIEFRARGVYFYRDDCDLSHKVNQYGEDLGALGIVDPIIALWVPFLLVWWI